MVSSQNSEIMLYVFCFPHLNACWDNNKTKAAIQFFYLFENLGLYLLSK